MGRLEKKKGPGAICSRGLQRATTVGCKLKLKF